MKQFLILAVALVAVAASAGERSSGGRRWVAHSVSFIFSEMYPRYWTSGEDPAFSSDLQLIRDVVGKDVATAEISEFRTDIIELSNSGKFPHPKLKTYVACLRVRNSGELARIRDSITNHLRNKLNTVEWNDCDWDVIKKIYSAKDLPAPVLRVLTP